MEKNLINQKVQVLRVQVDEIVKNLHDRSLEIKNEQLSKTISELRQRIHDPFMFVIVGEVKAGKSSFVNALLGVKEEVCKVAPQPMTDTIQQIVYGPASEEVINPYLKRISQPVEILKEIAIVDTPGTNTIIEHHQEITENFIPAADLIVFVFEAKNPYRQSSWEFFDYIKEEWRKKIIFVLQQKDLMEPDDLVVNTKGVYDYATKKGIPDPQVFVVSAKQELKDDLDGSGFKEIRAFIASNITGGRAPFLKIRNNLETCININDRIRSGVELRHAQYEQDITFRKNIDVLLVEEQKRNVKKVESMVDHLLRTYDSVTNETDRELVDGLGFGTLLKRTVSSLFDRKNSTKHWFEKLTKDLETNLNQSLQDRMQDGIDDISVGIQNMASKVGEQIQSSNTILKNDHEFFSAIADRRADILKELREEFDAFMKDSQNFYDKEVLPNDSNVGSNLAAGSGMAIIGMVLTAVTSVPVMDITGGILTAVGVLFAGITIGVNRQKVIKNYRLVIRNGRTKLEKELTSKLTLYINNIKGKIEQLFDRFDEHLDNEKQQIDIALQKDKEAQIGIQKCQETIEALLNPS